MAFDSSSGNPQTAGQPNNNDNDNDNNNNRNSNGKDQDETFKKQKTSDENESNNTLTTTMTSTPADNKTATQIQQTHAQLEAIEQEIKANQPLTSELLPLQSTLQSQYQPDDPSSKYFRLGIQVLGETYDQIRAIRGDGNCYYRAFLYSLCESLITNKKELDRIIKWAKESSSWVVGVGGYEEMAIDIFHESMVELLESLQKGIDPKTLHNTLTEENGASDYCTWYMRVVTATLLKSDPDRFLPYLDDENSYMDMAAFCQSQVEPMGKECTMVQVLALAEAVQVLVKIEYLDGHDFARSNNNNNNKLMQHVFGPESSETQLTLLYRPGHYDILYKKEAN